LDDESMSREVLARIPADDLLPTEADAALIIATVERYTRNSVFRQAAASLTACDSLPHPLRRFLAAAFTGHHSKVSRLASSCRFKESTLRNQWRAFRQDPTLRLEDILRHVADLRARGELSIDELQVRVKRLVLRVADVRCGEESHTPVFVGTRVPLATLFDYLEGGETLDDFLKQFPSVKRDQAQAALEQARDSLVTSARSA
jgi:uncharacterized protein (DUF433 family)